MDSSYGVDVRKTDFSPIYEILIEPYLKILINVITIAFVVLMAFLLYAFIKYRINPFKLSAEKLKSKKIKFQLFDCMRWIYVDLFSEKPDRYRFKEFGFTLYCGRQGAGKTISMVDYLNRMHEKYPKAKIVTNFKYEHATQIMKDWRDFFKIRNGMDGVIFALDEIHSELSTEKSKNFPESILSEISQQRKQRIKIVATSQVFSRVAKPVREQTFSVVQCVTYFNRWTFTREYDSDDYELQPNAIRVKKKLHPFNRHSFVQSDELRNCYDTYEKIERLKDEQFMLRTEH